MTVLANAKIVTAAEIVEGGVVLDGGEIAAVEPGRIKGDVDFGGHYLLPGLGSPYRLRGEALRTASGYLLEPHGRRAGP